MNIIMDTLKILKAFIGFVTVSNQFNAWPRII